MALRRGVAKLARQLGVPQFLRNILDSGAEDAAEETRKALEEVLKDVQNDSTRALNGYKAIKKNLSGSTTITLPQSGVQVRGDFDWLVSVVAPQHHKTMGLNVFNILDTGRREISKPGTYPMWGQERRQDPDNVTRTSRRVEPRSRGQKGAQHFVTVGGASGYKIPAVGPLNLYQEAKEKAERNLKRKKLPWEVIYVGDIGDNADG